MSVRDRIMNGIGSLAERISVDDHALTDVDSAKLERELAARKAARKAAPPKAPEDNPRSKYAGADESSAQKRRAMAERRAQKVHATRDKRDAARQKAHDDAFRRIKEQAARSDFSGTRTPPRTGSSSSRRSARSRVGFGSIGKKSEVAKAYKTLDLPEGAEFAKVKSAYRKLLRKYHPDRHGQSPKKLKAATELTMQVNSAYQVLDKHLNG